MITTSSNLLNKILRSVAGVAVIALLSASSACSVPASVKSPQSEGSAAYTKTPAPVINSIYRRPEIGDKSIKILLMGNSFIHSSQVAFFTEMMMKEKKKPVQVDAYYRGYYTVELFVNNFNEITKIRDDYYDIAFLGGLYTMTDYVRVEDFLKELKGTKTQVALFPADNEAVNFMSNSRIIYKDKVFFADWDLALEKLKLVGFNKMVINDEAKHTNEMSGFVGACVVYSLIYGEKPDSTKTAEYLIERYGEFVPGNTRNEKIDNLKKVEQIAFEVATM